MKFVSMFLALFFSFNLVVGSASSMEFEKALSEYQDVLTVKWDQKDQGFYRKATHDFYLKYEELILEKGLTPKDVLNVVSDKLNDPKTAVLRGLKATLVQSVSFDDDFMGLIRNANNIM